MPFIDREYDLEWLADGWESTKAEFRILYGRRRVGKSALLDEFARGKRHIMFQAVEGSTADQLRDLTAAVLECEPDPVLQAAPLANWEAALAQFTKMAATGRLLVVIDEYQYVAESDPSLASRLQRWWSREAVHSALYLVLCGSYVRFFVKNVLAGPAYGRNTGSLHLRPLSYRQAAQFLPHWSSDDKIRAYAVAGGVPHYLEQFDPRRSLAWNIEHNILRRGSVLYQEAELLVREELREPRVYFSILRAISDGCTKVGDITARVQPPSSRSDITPYLTTLQELGLVEYQPPVVGAAARRGIWRVTDPYLRFWFKFVVPNRTRLEHGGSPARVFRDVVAPRLDEFVSRPAFEEICRAWMGEQANAGASPVEVERVGAWWGPMPRPTPQNPRHQVEAELEVIAVQGAAVTLAGEVKWTRTPVGLQVLSHLRDVVKHVPGATDATRLALFARTFDEGLIALAGAEGVLLITPADLYA